VFILATRAVAEAYVKHVLENEVAGHVKCNERRVKAQL